MFSLKSSRHNQQPLHIPYTAPVPDEVCQFQPTSVAEATTIMRVLLEVPDVPEDVRETAVKICEQTNRRAHQIPKVLPPKLSRGEVTTIGSLCTFDSDETISREIRAALGIVYDKSKEDKIRAAAHEAEVDEALWARTNPVVFTPEQSRCIVETLLQYAADPQAPDYPRNDVLLALGQHGIVRY